MLVTPSILVSDIHEFWRQIERLAPFYQHFQIDIADGLFVPNRTIQIEDILRSLPNYELLTTNYSLIFDLHLMVKDYEKEIKKLDELKDKVNIDVVLIHFSVVSDYELLTTNYSLKFGIALNPEDSVTEMSKKLDLKQVSAIQIMSVHPGKQGQEFLPDTLNKIEQLRNAYYRGEIYLDGAINEKTLPIILSKKFKPGVIGPGSFFSQAENVEEKGRLLKKLLADQ